MHKIFDILFMEILEIQDDCLYAVKYPEEEYDEYNRIFEDYSNFDKVHEFFETHKWEIGQYYVKELGFNRNETEAYAQYVVDETIELEEYFEDLIDNTINHDIPSLYGHFEFLEGFEKEDIPAMKSYGLSKPSMLRVYAVEVNKQCLIIFYSGIKIEHSLSDCPVLKENVLSKAYQLIEFLKEKEVVCAEDVKRIAK